MTYLISGGTMKKLFLFLGLIVTASCTQYWEKPGSSQGEFDVTLAGCESKAMSLAPPMMQTIQISAGYMTPVTTQCSGYGQFVNCYSTGGQYMPPQFMTIDANKSNRERQVNSCLRVAGWTPVERSLGQRLGLRD